LGGLRYGWLAGAQEVIGLHPLKGFMIGLEAVGTGKAYRVRRMKKMVVVIRQESVVDYYR
jgi:hypothetical protein